MNNRIDELLLQLQKMSPMPADDEDEALTEELLDQYVAVVDELHQLLEPSRDKRAIAPLIRSFGYGIGYEIYWSTLHTLEKFDAQQILPHLIDAVQRGERGSRMWAAYMLGRCQDERAIPSLLRLLNDPEEYVRAHAVTALSMISDPSTIEVIASLRNDPSAEVRSVVKNRLTDFQDQRI